MRTTQRRSDTGGAPERDLDDEPPSGRAPATACLPDLPSSPPAAQRRRARHQHQTEIADRFRASFYPGVSRSTWNDWRWQLRNRIRTIDELSRFLRLSRMERAAFDGGPDTLPLAVTPYYLGLLSPGDPDQPLRRSVVPTAAERLLSQGEASDPLGEEHDSPVPGLVHRYPDRVLLLAHGECAAYCRYCTRSRVVGRRQLAADTGRLERAIDYIRDTPAVRDVVVSGGDPLLLSDERLAWLLGRLRAVPHVEVIRIGTKVPAVLPQRVTPALVRVLRRYHPLWMSLHFTHPDECTPESRRACARLADAGIPLGSQTVLLRGVNDDLETMRALVRRLMAMRVRPYYLYQCDPISGSGHFRTPIERGLAIIRGLRGFTSGYAVPTFVVDAPGGGGKIPLLPDAVVGRELDDLLLRSFDGGVYRYPDPGGAPPAVD